MNKMVLIIRREYLERVKKRSFLIATVLTPLLIPIIILGIAYLTMSSLDEDKKKSIEVVDESGFFQTTFDSVDLDIKLVRKSPEQLRDDVVKEVISGGLYIPKINLHDPRGIEYYSKTGSGMAFLRNLSQPLENEIQERKLKLLNLENDILDRLKTNVSIKTFDISDTGQTTESSSEISSILGYIMSILMYLFVFMYGSMIMQSVLNEKTNKIVEVIISSIKPFQLMLGKILAIAAVALTQMAVWIIIISIFTSILSLVFGFGATSAQTPDILPTIPTSETPKFIMTYMDISDSLPVGKILFLFIFYFLGGFLLYGGLFAAVGSAVDSIQEANQFTVPLSIPLIFSIGLMSAVLGNPNSALSVTLSLIPFTSPILMMVRIPFDISLIQVISSMFLLVLGFILMIWISSRIYRVGILTSGSKVTWKTLITWFNIKNY